MIYHDLITTITVINMSTKYLMRSLAIKCGYLLILTLRILWISWKGVIKGDVNKINWDFGWKVLVQCDF